MSELEHKCGLKKGFFERLQKEDDWSFIIKIHMLIESSVTLLVTKGVEIPELEDFLSSLNLNDQRRGKMAIVNALKLFTPEEAKVVRAISEIRNKLVHHVTQAEFNLEDYIQSLNESQLKTFLDAFSGTYFDAVTLATGEKIGREQYIIQNPKISIWRTALLVLAIFSKQVGILEMKKETKEIKSEIFDRLSKIHGLNPPPLSDAMTQS